MLSAAKIIETLERLPRLSIAVVGDFFLDKYLEIDGRLTEKSLETGLAAYQVTSVRTSPGAGGTVTNNLSALGVGRIVALTVVGVDGEGFELKRELAARRVDLTHVIETADRRTPTYTKPLLDDGTGRGPPRELNRLDIKNRHAMPALLVREIAQRLDQVVAECDAVIIADQVSEPECGVVTLAVRERLAALATRHPQKIVLADSRERIGRFRNVLTKPNQNECLRAIATGSTALQANAGGPTAVEVAARMLGRRTGRPVFCTLGDQGILYVAGDDVARVPAVPVKGPIDIVGAGDSTTAGIVCGLCAGLEPLDAASFGNLIASITIQQIGTTGTATSNQVISRWCEVTKESSGGAPKSTA